jgi:hypothetical protein
MRRQIFDFHHKDWSNSLTVRTWLALYPKIDIDITLGYSGQTLIQLSNPREFVASLQPNTAYVTQKNA